MPCFLNNYFFATAVLLCFFPAQAVSAQSGANGSTVTGRVVDAATRQAIPGASVWCHAAADGKLLKVEYAKEDGSFSWQPPKQGDYRLVFKAFAYKTDTVAVKVGGAAVALGEVRLSGTMGSGGAIDLDGVQVTARGAPIEMHSDRLVYDVTRDPDAKRLKMTDIMEKIPSMNASSGKLEFGGMAVDQILIDGERHEFINADTQFPMRLIRGDVMSKIEVIPPGSPQYGNDRTLINIITSRPLPDGIAVEIQGGGRTDNQWDGKADLVSKIRDRAVVRLGYSTSWQESPKLGGGSLRDIYSGETPVSSIESRHTTWRENQRHNFILRGSTNLLGRKLDMGLKTSFGENGFFRDLNRTTTDAQTGDILKENVYYSSETRTTPTLSGDLKYTINSSKTRRTHLSYNYADNRSGSSSETTTTPGAQGSAAELRTGSENSSAVHTAQFFDLINFGKAHSLTTRALYSNRMYSDRAEYTGSAADGISYRQQVASVAPKYVYRIPKFSFSLTAGVEYERNRGTFLGTGTPLDHSDFSPAPMADVTWRPIKNYSVSGYYSLRNVRPSMNMLNPYVDYSDPMNISYGNPRLRSESLHRVSGGISRNLGSFVGNARLGFSYEVIPGAIERVTRLTGNGATATTYENVGRKRTYRISSENIIPLPGRFFLACYAGYRIILFDSPLADIGDNRAEGFDCIANLSGRLWKSGTLRFDYLLTSTLDVSQTVGTGYLHRYSVRLDQSIIKNRLSASVTVNNPFKSADTMHSEIRGDGFRTVSWQEHMGRVVGFSLRCNFGRLKDRVADAEALPNDTSRD